MLETIAMCVVIAGAFTVVECLYKIASQLSNSKQTLDAIHRELRALGDGVQSLGHAIERLADRDDAVSEEDLDPLDPET